MLSESLTQEKRHLKLLNHSKQSNRLKLNTRCRNLRSEGLIISSNYGFQHIGDNRKRQKLWQTISEKEE
jgi:hypothetical protein